MQTHEEDAVETDTQPAMFRSFREVQELWETEPHSQLLQVSVTLRQNGL